MNLEGRISRLETLADRWINYDMSDEELWNRIVALHALWDGQIPDDEEPKFAEILAPLFAIIDQGNESQ